MLKEFIEGQHRSEPTSNDKYYKAMVEAFDGCIDLLRDTIRFPNKEINDAVKLMWHLIGNKETPVVLDQWGFPSLSFAVMGDGKKRFPFLVIPTDFLQQIDNDPVFQLGIVAYMASQCRDFYCGMITGNNSDEVNRRARAFDVEVLNTLQELAKKEGVPLTFDPLQQQYMNEFPNGLRSLPQGMMYSTPEYRPHWTYEGLN